MYGIMAAKFCSPTHGAAAVKEMHASLGWYREVENGQRVEKHAFLGSRRCAGLMEEAGADRQRSMRF